jgi:hypothetical protein
MLHLRPYRDCQPMLKIDSRGIVGLPGLWFILGLSGKNRYGDLVLNLILIHIATLVACLDVVSLFHAVFKIEELYTAEISKRTLQWKNEYRRDHYLNRCQY